MNPRKSNVPGRPAPADVNALKRRKRGTVTYFLISWNWLFRQLDGSREENAAKARRIAELEERVQQLEAELMAERQKQSKAARPEEDEGPPGLG